MGKGVSCHAAYQPKLPHAKPGAGARESDTDLVFSEDLAHLNPKPCWIVSGYNGIGN